MMNDLAMHILELIMNSIKAGCSNLSIMISDSLKLNQIKIEVEDDGKGMSDEQITKATDPFNTSRDTRNIGMGLAFAKGLAQMCEGELTIKSQINKGTHVSLILKKDHIDLPPWGDLGEMVMMGVQANENIELQFEYANDVKTFDFNTKQVKAELAGVSILQPDVLLWIKDYINQGIDQCKEDYQ